MAERTGLDLFRLIRQPDSSALNRHRHCPRPRRVLTHCLLIRLSLFETSKIAGLVREPIITGVVHQRIVELQTNHVLGITARTSTGSSESIAVRTR